MKTRRRETGLSLVEMAVSVSVVAVGLLGTVAALVIGSDLASATTANRASSRAASSLMEQMRTSPFEDLVDSWNETSVIMPVHADDTALTVLVDVQPVDSGNSDANTVYKVSLQVIANTETATVEREYTTYVSNRTSGSVLSGIDDYVEGATEGLPEGTEVVTND